MNSNFSLPTPTPQTKLDFTSIIAGPCVGAMSEQADYEHKHETELQNSKSMSLYELETKQCPHTFQRQLMQKMFTGPASSATQPGQPQVTLFRRLTDTFAEFTTAPAAK
ncbi:MAG: hypothetical protein SGBAC_013225 [Bacillariaceae sp.]